MTPVFHLPRYVIAAILVCTLGPVLLAVQGWGFDFSATEAEFEPLFWGQLIEDPQLLAYLKMAGPLLHTVLESIAFCISILTGLLSIVHYRLKRDITTPIIGTAFFFTAILDGSNILAADCLTFPIDNLQDFVPFTWIVSAIFNVAILTAGILPFVLRRKISRRQKQPHETRYLILMGLLIGLIAYGLIHLIATRLSIPETIYPELTLSRPFELIPLLLWVLLAALVLPRFQHRFPSILAHSLRWAAVPAIASHLVAGFGSTALFDANFFNAYLLKILFYSVPLIGLLFDYIKAYRAEVVLEKTETKLEAARQIQTSLLPADSPNIPGIDAAGFSFASEAVGGDYYDFIRLADDRFGVVVGDVSGHDLAASLLAAECRAYLRAFADSLDDLSDIITRLNKAILHDTQHRRFITMFCAVIDEDQKGVSFAAAGHQAYLIRQGNNIEMLDSNTLPLGMMDGPQIEIAHVAAIKSGDILLIVTDGITEALSPAGEQYGLQRLLDFICVGYQTSLSELSRQLQEDVNQFCKGRRPADDVTVAMIRWQ